MPVESMLVVFTVFSDILYIKLSVDHSVLLIKLSGYVVTLKTVFLAYHPIHVYENHTRGYVDAFDAFGILKM